MESKVLGKPVLPDRPGSWNSSEFFFDYCNVINGVFIVRTADIFGCFCGVMTQFEFMKHKFLN